MKGVANIIQPSSNSSCISGSASRKIGDLIKQFEIKKAPIKSCIIGISKLSFHWLNNNIAHTALFLSDQKHNQIKEEKEGILIEFGFYPPEKGEEASRISSCSLAGKTTVAELVELVRRARFLVTPDSGPMHIAGALGTRCIALFSKDLPSRWAPQRNCVPLTLGVECAPCDDERARSCAHVRCMREISAEMVLEACDGDLE